MINIYILKTNAPIKNDFSINNVSSDGNFWITTSKICFIMVVGRVNSSLIPVKQV